MNRQLCSLISALVLVWLSAPAASAVVSISVPPDGSGNPPDIQRAIEMASPSDSSVILLPDGVFRGPGNRNLDYLGKRILIRSVTGDLRNHANYSGGGLASTERDDEYVIARSCTFHDNDSPGTSAAYCLLGYGQDGYIRNSIFTSNRGGPPLCCPGGHHGLWVSCSCLYGNEGGDGFQSNLIADPLYCLSDSLDFTLHADTPCSTAHCGLMGAYPIGCRGEEETSGVPASRAEPQGIRVWPNLVTSACTIALPPGGDLRVDVFNAAGACIRRLRAAGAARALIWDGRDERGRKAGPGVYLLRAQGAHDPTSRRVVVLR
jgi:hypothetical protein